ncbi:MAG: hypothetical protein ATN36_07525 [Epulopiscium sp. Nele67-Bin005]|nr:MAG: hypothetical protein ATN36_07525 [Epulopiscium sp. Nele67-Bin005]
MKKVSIIFGSTTGNTEEAAGIIKSHLTDAEISVIDVCKVKNEDVTGADLVILGASTWGWGEIQDDFIPFYEDMSSELFDGKEFAVFGCGDKDGYEDTFCEAVTLISEKAKECGGVEKVEPLKIDGDVSDSADQIKQFATSLN